MAIRKEKDMTKSELIAKAMEQEERLERYRGYSSGMTAEKMEIFDEQTLIEIINKMEKKLKRLGI